MRILVTGAGGQLGRMFVRLASQTHEVTPCVHRPTPDLPDAPAFSLAESDVVARAVAQAEPDWVVNAAAMTGVDECERDPKRARHANADGAGNVAKAAARSGARLVQVSTDYVFDGVKGRYLETDGPRPIQEYGRSKLGGEEQAVAAMPGAVVARASVVFGPDRPNFVTWLAAELGAGRGVRIVEDQWVSPTYTADLSRQILALIEAGAEGVFHTAGPERLSRLEMARTVADVNGFDTSLIRAVKMKDLAWEAARPRDSSLDVAKVSRLARPMRFRDAVRALVEVETA